MDTRFQCVYLLTSDDPQCAGHYYIGYTVDPMRRLRQHNGDMVNGAWRTHRRGRPWRMVCCVTGFPEDRIALKFEWVWQHPLRALQTRDAVKEVLGKLSKKVFSASKQQHHRRFSDAGTAAHRDHLYGRDRRGLDVAVAILHVLLRCPLFASQPLQLNILDPERFDAAAHSDVYRPLGGRGGGVADVLLTIRRGITMEQLNALRANVGDDEEIFPTQQQQSHHLNTSGGLEGSVHNHTRCEEDRLFAAENSLATRGLLPCALCGLPLQPNAFMRCPNPQKHVICDRKEAVIETIDDGFGTPKGPAAGRSGPQRGRAQALSVASDVMSGSFLSDTQSRLFSADTSGVADGGAHSPHSRGCSPINRSNLHCEALTTHHPQRTDLQTDTTFSVLMGGASGRCPFRTHVVCMAMWFSWQRASGQSWSLVRSPSPGSRSRSPVPPAFGHDMPLSQSVPLSQSAQNTDVPLPDLIVGMAETIECPLCAAWSDTAQPHEASEGRDDVSFNTSAANNTLVVDLDRMSTPPKILQPRRRRRDDHRGQKRQRSENDNDESSDREEGNEEEDSLDEGDQTVLFEGDGDRRPPAQTLTWGLLVAQTKRCANAAANAAAQQRRERMQALIVAQRQRLMSAVTVNSNASSRHALGEIHKGGHKSAAPRRRRGENTATDDTSSSAANVSFFSQASGDESTITLETLSSIQGSHGHSHSHANASRWVHATRTTSGIDRTTSSLQARDAQEQAATLFSDTSSRVMDFLHDLSRTYSGNALEEDGHPAVAAMGRRVPHTSPSTTPAPTSYALSYVPSTPSSGATTASVTTASSCAPVAAGPLGPTSSTLDALRESLDSAMSALQQVGEGRRRTRVVNISTSHHHKDRINPEEEDELLGTALPPGAALRATRGPSSSPPLVADALIPPLTTLSQPPRRGNQPSDHQRGGANTSPLPAPEAESSFLNEDWFSNSNASI